jgi:hypothetical protein
MPALLGRDAASWDGAPVEIFSTDLKVTGVRKMELPVTHLLAVSSSGEMAVLQSADPRFNEARCFIQNIDGGTPRPITPEGVSDCQVSPDGQLVVGNDLTGGGARFYPMDGGPPRAIPGLLPGETLAWSPDPHFLYVYQWRQLPIKLYRLNVVSGERQLFKEMHPLDETGLCDMAHIIFSADGRAYVYSYTRLLSELYLVKGLR